MSMYPSLEDMKIDQMAKSQIMAEATQFMINYDEAVNTTGFEPSAPSHGALYPALGEYMGLELSQAVIAANMPEYLNNAVVPTGTDSQMIAPLSGQSVGLRRAQVTNGVRQLTLCKDKDHKVGLRVKPIDNGVFVCLVVENSPAALAGLRFGDQILQINGENVAGYSMDKVHKLLKKSPENGISIAVRDRPFERTITLHKDSTKHVGFHVKNGKIVSIVQDSSAARNGVLINHQLLEVQGQNVVGMKDKEIVKIIDESEDVVTITVIPSFLYDHMVQKMAGSLIKNLMDHSVLNL